jgi:hypothetical protein
MLKTGKDLEGHELIWTTSEIWLDIRPLAFGIFQKRPSGGGQARKASILPALPPYPSRLEVARSVKFYCNAT